MLALLVLVLAKATNCEVYLACLLRLARMTTLRGTKRKGGAALKLKDVSAKNRALCLCIDSF
jgi:hypothetical protein